MTFINTTIPIKEEEPRDRHGYYLYDQVSPLLYVWSKLLQATISLAGTKLLTGKYHDSHCAIYKSEGGCNIVEVGDLVLQKDYCYFDYQRSSNKSQLSKLRDLITRIVVEWDPNNPVNSMINSAAATIGVAPESLKQIIEKHPDNNNNPFGGDQLSSFFDHNPFSRYEYDRNYLRFCLKKFDEKTDEEVDQKFADEDLSIMLENKIKNKLKGSGEYIFCCTPKRNENGLQFWINSSKFSGWKTEPEIEEWLGENVGAKCRG